MDKPQAKELTSRDVEASMLSRCVQVARSGVDAANDPKEANVFRVASMLIDKRYPAEAQRLRHASSRYFGAHPDEKTQASEVVKNGWVWGLPRLRDMLSRELSA